MQRFGQMIASVALLALCVSCRPGDAQLSVPCSVVQVDCRDGLPFGSRGHLATLSGPAPLDDAGGRYPALVLLHHGGWAEGSRHDIAEQARAIAREGVVVLCPDYTLASAETEPALATMMTDIGEAIDCVSRMECVRPGRVSLGGISAGGHLALVYAATQPNTLHAVVAVEAPTDLAALREYVLDKGLRPGLDWLIGVGASEDALRAASPQHMDMRALTMPVVLAQGSLECLGSLTDMAPLYERLTADGRHAALMQTNWGDPFSSHVYAHDPAALAGFVQPYLR